MFDSTILEIGLGLILVYFLMSLFCTALNEWIMRIFSMRAKTLKSGLIQMLGGGKKPETGEVFAEKLFNHPLIKGATREGLWQKFTGLFTRKKDAKPSNISNRNFALALIDCITPDNSEHDLNNLVKNMSENLRDSIKSSGLPDDIQKMLQTFLISASTKQEEVLVKFQKSIEEWFDDTMDRVTGWYKRKAQLIILIIAVLACVGLNVDTFAIATSLSHDDALRASVVAAAEKRVLDEDEETTIKDHEEIKEEIVSLGLPIGWNKDDKGKWEIPINTTGWVLKICGILLTAFLVALGSPFWFDLLNKIVNLRSSGNKPDKTK